MAISKTIKFEPVATDRAMPMNTLWNKMPASRSITCKRFFCCCWASVRRRRMGRMLPLEEARLALDMVRLWPWRRAGVLGAELAVVREMMRLSMDSVSESESAVEMSEVIVARWRCWWGVERRSMEMFSLCFHV